MRNTAMAETMGARFLAPAAAALCLLAVGCGKRQASPSADREAADEAPASPAGAAGAPLVHYPFDGNAEDAGPNGLDGTMSGPKPVEGRVKKALQFDGTDDHVEIPQEAFNNLPAGSVAFWVRPEAYACDVFYKETYNPTTISGIRINDDGTVQATHNNFGIALGGDPEDIIGDTSIPQGEWTHIVWTWDGNTARLYVNGALDATRETNQGVADDAGQAKWVRWGRGDSHFAGALDDIWILNRAVKEQDVNRLHAGSAPGM